MTDMRPAAVAELGSDREMSVDLGKAMHIQQQRAVASKQLSGKQRQAAHA